MSRRPFLGLLLPVVLAPVILLGGVSPLPLVHADEFDEATAGRRVTALLEKDLGDDPRAVWVLSESLAAGGKPAIKALRDAVDGAPPARQLAIARALILLEDFTRGLGLLRQVVGDDAASPALKEAALRVIGFEGELEDAEWLEERIDTTHDPLVKMGMAKALWNLNYSNKRKGKEVLLQYLRSTDKDRRAEGALALGEIGAAGEARPVLLELRDEPSERGRSAAFLLQILGLEQAAEQDLRGGPEQPEPDPDLGPGLGKVGTWPLLDEIWEVLEKVYVDADKVERRRLESAMASGLTEALDPFTAYLSEEDNARLRQGLDPTYGGVGAYVYNDPKNQERFTISRPIFGGPIYRAGIRAGDIILSINGETTEGLTVEDCVRLLKGPPGTEVNVSIYRAGWDEARPFSLRRARITLPTTAYDLLPGNIGFIQILSFSQDTAREVAKILDLFDEKKVTGIVLDLRFNGGGYLHSAVEIASQFLPPGTLVVTERGRKGTGIEQPHYSAGLGTHRRPVPIVIMVNRATASAAEILAGSLRVHGKARLVGTMSFGKGSVQRPWDLRTRPGEPFEDQVRDVPVRYTDRNGNDRLDAGEPVTTRPLKNDRYDAPEKFEDVNGNGRHDEGEPFTDENYNDKWDDGEPFTDLNANNDWDPGANLKLTVAAYYLPDGTRLERKTEVVDKKLVTSGGLEPDVEAEQRPIDFWELQAQRKLEAGQDVDAYVERLFKEHPDLTQRLGRSDQRDPSLYPEFDVFWKGLETPLGREPVRFLVRWNIRRQLGDDLGRELVGDVIDDAVLQAAVRDLFRTSGRDLAKEPDLAFLGEDDEEETPTDENDEE